MQWGRGAFLENSLFAQDVDNTIEISHGVTCLMACCVGSSSSVSSCYVCHTMLGRLPLPVARVHKNGRLE